MVNEEEDRRNWKDRHRKNLPKFNLLHVINSNTFTDIFNKIGGKGLMASASTVTADFMNYLSHVNTPTEGPMDLDEHDQIDLTGALLGQPIKESMTSFISIDALNQGEIIDLGNIYDDSLEEIDKELLSLLRKNQYFLQAKREMEKETAALLTNKMRESGKWTEAGNVDRIISDFLLTPVAENYFTHAFLSTAGHMEQEQQLDLGGLEESRLKDPMDEDWWKNIAQEDNAAWEESVRRVDEESKMLKMPNWYSKQRYNDGIYQFLEEIMLIPAEEALKIPFDARKLGMYLRYKVNNLMTEAEFDTILRMAADGAYKKAIDALMDTLDTHRVAQLKQLKLDRAERQKKIRERKKWRDKNEKVD
jgi:hypothetical protein